ncbi:hypothetical protein PFICI_13456 [Pestalotiopsis fici W106-1]|uniref:Heterokaryon incompatibility domain-containing protein n=1 Tax=Pestalotiopsis fici (strain W106-1 / CGMCC3.15140) TaxID=1229662 RepID=W3WPA7_PESFW|nr:uncharacterized protein PFICI_13456 [Pestalotiopsis fici W106-1]ETS74972.1 hypothetical protein PFICI_13456 [Pestalotiopsis fici W106-1]
MDSLYQHFPLDPRSIRIIVLEPASDPSSDIQCGLHKASLDYVLDFEALSYTWDGQTPECPISCRTVENLNDFPSTPFSTILVTQNCVDALRALRRQSGRRLLWIDGICINQADIDEKGVQVAMMGELYGACRGVIVWLGNKDEAAERAFRFMLDIGGAMENMVSRQRASEPTSAQVPLAEDIELHESLREMLQNLQRMSKEQYNPESENPLRPLLNRSWFHRMWTVQEVVLPAQGDVTFQCGDLKASFPTLRFVATQIEVAKFTKVGIQSSMKLQLELTDALARRRLDGMDGDQNSDAVKQGYQNFTRTNFSHILHMYNQGDGNRTSKIKLSAILDGARRKRVTVPADKVFALYGVFQELGIPMSAPDYRKPTEDVFHDAAVASISSEKALDVIYLAVTKTRRENLPSWVPDLMDHGFGNMDPRNCTEDVKRFTAGSSLPPAWEFLPSHRLRVCVKLVETVTKSFPSFDVHVKSLQGHEDNLEKPSTSQASLAQLHKALTLLREWAEAVRGHAASYPSRKDMVMSFLKVLLHDEKSCVNHAEEEDRFDKWFSVLEKDDVELMRSSIMKNGKEMSKAKLAKVAEYQGSSVLKQLKSWKAQMSNAFEERERSSKSFAVGMLGHVGMQNVTYPAMEPVLQLHLAILRFARRQAFFTTETGRFGCAPDFIAAGAVREGDRVAIIAGLSLPFVLRPLKRGGSVRETDEYELISHCYQDGIMYGEAVHGDGTELQDVVLV